MDKKQPENEKIEIDNSFALDGTIPIADLVDMYPEVVDYLSSEYDFYCLNCFLSEFETLEEGAKNHGIEGADFVQMLKEVNEIILK